MQQGKVIHCAGCYHEVSIFPWWSLMGSGMLLPEPLICSGLCPRSQSPALMALVPCGFFPWGMRPFCDAISELHSDNVWHFQYLEMNSLAGQSHSSWNSCNTWVWADESWKHKKGIYKENLLLCFQEGVLFPPILLLKPKISLDCAFCPQSILQNTFCFVLNRIKLVYF